MSEVSSSRLRSLVVEVVVASRSASSSEPKRNSSSLIAPQIGSLGESGLCAVVNYEFRERRADVVIILTR